MKRHGPKAPSPPETKRPTPSQRLRLTADTIFAVVLGVFFGLCLLKFGNPPVMEKYVEAPKTGFELLATAPWPLSWAYWMIAVLTVFGALLAVSDSRKRRQENHSKSQPHISLAGLSAPLWMLFLPLIWLLWQLV